MPPDNQEDHTAPYPEERALLTHTRMENEVRNPIVINEVPEKDNSLQEREKKNTNIIRTKTTSNSNETGQVTIKFGRKPGKLNPPPGSTPNNKSRPNKNNTKFPAKYEFVAFNWKLRLA